MPRRRNNLFGTMDEKISIKNLLFTKAIPNYTLPVRTDGRQFFSCTDCGDRFIIKSSYEYHVNRKSLKITYVCRYCNEEKTFYNRCNLLCHIRSHVFKTATINISDIKIEPLPLSDFNYQNRTTCENEVPLPTPTVNNTLKNQDIHTEAQKEDQTMSNVICFDCKKNIYHTGIFYKDRERHYMEYTNSLYSCPVCLMSLFTQCALKCHIRLHLKEPPFYCPECGIHLGNKILVYPYSHDCESFKMMRATAKLMCLVKNCSKIFHPNGIAKHLKTHLKKVYKCSSCSVACYKLPNMLKHFKTHKTKVLKLLEFFQCEMCPGRLVIPNQIDRHLKTHEKQIVHDVYPCWTCGATFKLAKSLIQHQIVKHSDVDLKNIYGENSQEPTESVPYYNLKTRSCYSLDKNCENCLNNFISRHSSNKKDTVNQHSCTCNRDDMSQTQAYIVCHICKLQVILDWALIKTHYATYHNEHKCLDAKIVINKLDINQYKKGIVSVNKRKKVKREKKVINNVTELGKGSGKNTSKSGSHTGDFVCNKCGEGYENKMLLETHMITHKDPFMAYQCMECGESFIAKGSFSTHLLLKHGINNVNEYIDQKKCYNEGALHANLQTPNNIDESAPVKENQCNICREEFSDSTEFKKHFRVHGMAFLMRNSNMAVSPEKQ
ncbi:zinc finger protein 532-like [Epargyreus clarus]|uniref:zinc finger protein 532-like n=1 Tax=Epargyreus clarus TaxID=520877 RepID=UPI003C2EABD6